MLNKTDARAASRFCKVSGTNASGKPTSVLVPGHNGKTYEVIVRRNCGLSCECRLCTGATGHVDCQGNSKSICYHSLAAVMFLADQAGQSLAICESYKAAVNLSAMGGKIFKLSSWQSNKTSWIVSKEK